MAQQSFRLLSWNVRGLNSQIRRDVVRDMVRTTKPTVVCLQQTKLQLISDDIVMQTLGTQFREHYFFLPADGVKGGILVAVSHNHFCRISLFTVDSLEVNKFAVKYFEK